MSIVPEEGAHANANHVVFQTIAKKYLKLETAEAKTQERAELEKLKAALSFTSLLIMDGVRVNSGGSQPRCLCPFHVESTPSFTIYNDQHGHCFGCEWHGDAIEYLKSKYDCDFSTAKSLLQELAASGRVAANSRRVSTPPKEISTRVFTEEQRKEGEQMARYLKENQRLIDSIAESRKWKPETIAKLALSGHLGWHEQSIAFIYETGIKLRPWPWRKDYITWHCGKPSLWCGDTIPAATEVYIAEGETDAIALMDAGVSSGNRAVIAVPSATTFNPAWASAFAGKIVTLCFDNDSAGEKGMEKVAGYLAPGAAELYTINWKEVANV